MILLASATYQEISHLYPSKKIREGEITPHTLGNGKNAHILVTGVGVAATTFHLTSALSSGKYTRVLNLGVAGSFKPDLIIGTVVFVNQDTFADYGIDSNGSFSSVFQVGLTDPNQKPFTDGWLHCPENNLTKKVEHLTSTKGITVATVSGSEKNIESLIKRTSPDIETMESAAVFYCCLMAGVPFICVRAISNMVEPRKSASWNLPLAIENVCKEVQNIIEFLP